MATTKIRSSSQLYIDENLNFNLKKGINISPATTSGDVVEFDQMNTAISNAGVGVGNSIHVPVADLAAAKAVTDYVDKMIMLIEELGLYRFDAEATTASNDGTIIRPTNIASDASPGRWIKMSSTITDHNLLSGLQGGTTGQYYHLTAAEVALLSGQALSKVDDTNITLSLGGSASTALLRAASITVGWSGTLAVGRGGTGASTLTGIVVGNATSAMTAITGTAGQLLRRNAGNTAYEFFTPTYISGNQTITLNGEASGSGTTTIAVTLSNAAVIAKVLTGYTATSGTITATDSILTAIQKLGYDKHVAVTLPANSGLTLTGQQLAMGTPSTITSASTNSITGSTHSHAITASIDLIGNGTAQYQTLVTGGTPFSPVWTTSINLFGTSGLNSLTYVSPSFVKMTGTNTFTLDTNTYLTGNQSISLTDDVTGSGTTSIATTIGPNKVTFAKMQQVSTQIFLGRNTASTGNVEALSITTVKSMLGLNASNQSTRVYRVSPSGTINGSNTTFTIAALVLSGTEEIYKNGILMNAGAGNDYTISYGATTTITFATAPSSTPFTDVLLVNYSI